MSEQLALTYRKEENDAQELIEITTYIREDQALALEIIENARRYGIGVNFDRGTLIREALDLLIEKNIVGIMLNAKRVRLHKTHSRSGGESERARPGPRNRR